MTDDKEHPLVDRLRWVSEWYFVDPIDGKAYASDDPLDAADIIEGLLEKQAQISNKNKQLREALIHTAGICNPASGFLKNAIGARKKHIENVCDIARAALEGAA